MQRKSASRLAIIGAAVMASAPFWSFAQTSATWTFLGNGNWGTASNWNGAFPDGGGVATFNTQPQTTTGPVITLDVPVTLSGIVFDSPWQYQIAATGTNAITLTGPVFASVLDSNGNSPTLFGTGHIISRPIAGGVGLTKSGPGTVTAAAANTFTGDVTINGGTLRITTGDTGLGNLANNLIFDGGVLRASTTALNTARNVTVNVGGGTIDTFVAAAQGISGIMSGAGNFYRNVGGSTFSLSGANTISGSINQLSAGTIMMTGGGTALSASAINSAGTVTLDNVGTNNPNRLNDAMPINSHGAGLALLGNVAGSTESIGALTHTTGQGFVQVNPNAATNSQLTMASWTRGNRSTAVFRGLGLGNAPAANVGNIFMTAAPALVGGGGAAGSQNISIIQGAMGGTTATDLGTNMVTYGANGVRPLSLAAGEYRTGLGAGAATDNVRLAVATATAADETMNSLVLAGGALTGANTLSITSGMVINSAAVTHTANLAFGSTEAVFHLTSSGSFTGVISGSGGLTKSGTSTMLMGNLHTYSGTTTVTNGQVTVTASVPANAPSAFGNSDDPIVIQPGNAVARIWTNFDGTVFDRDIVVRGAGTGVAGLGVTVAQNMTVNGDIDLQRQLTIEGSSTGVITLNGTVSGSGRLSDAFTAITVLNGNNTFSGGIDINPGASAAPGPHYRAGSNTAFGTGPIFVSNTGQISAFGGARTLANPIFMQAAAPGLTIAGADALTMTGPIDLNGGTQTFTVTNSANTTLAGVISRGAMTKAGAGKLILTNANTHTGVTTVSAGILQVDNVSGSGTGGGAVQVNGGTLSGTGSMAGPVTFGAAGNLAPGASPGTLTMGGLTLAGTTNLFWELDTAGIVGSGVNDLAVVNGNLTLDGVMSVIQLAGFGPGTYRLIDYSGTLIDNGLTLNPLAAPFNGSIDVSTPGQVNLVVLPEPGSLALAGGLLAFGLRRRRR